MTVHMPLRPAWTCVVCDDLWPCATRRQQLTAEFFDTPMSLGLLMGQYFGEAINDLPHWVDEDIYHRFLGWIREHQT